MMRLIDILSAGLSMTVAVGVVAVLAITYWAHVPEEIDRC